MHHIVIKRYFNIFSAVGPCCFKPEKILQYKKIIQVKLFSNQSLFYRLQFVIFFKVAKFVEKSDKRLNSSLECFPLHLLFPHTTGHLFVAFLSESPRHDLHLTDFFVTLKANKTSCAKCCGRRAGRAR